MLASSLALSVLSRSTSSSEAASAEAASLLMLATSSLESRSASCASSKDFCVPLSPFLQH